MACLYDTPFLFWSDFLNRNELKLDSRLSLCAEFVRSGSRLADIGTDHAYLPVYLAIKGKITSAIAADINKGPLESGVDTINRYGVSDIVSARLSNGLEKIQPHECDDIVIAGMGGELICSIIEKVQWVKSPDKRLILQPMTKPEVLRSFLYSNGFEIEREQAVESDSRIYTVMLVHFTGSASALTDFAARAGKLDPNKEVDRLYLKRVLNSLRKKQNGLLCGGNNKDAAELNDTIDKLNNFIQEGENNEGQ